MRSSRSHYVFSIAAGVALAGAAGILLFLVIGSGVTARPAPGLLHSTEIKIAPEISGRVAHLNARSGQRVAKGDVLVELSNPELTAALVLAKAQLDEARATRNRVYAGIREEQVGALARETDMAKANLTYAEQEFARKSQLAADGFASRQDLDNATAAVEVARARLNSTLQVYQAAHAGPIAEELAIADTKVQSAATSVAVVAARVAKLRVAAPADGVVKLIVSEPGEAVIPGQPIMTIERTGNRWASFNLREDQMNDVRIGEPVWLFPVGTIDGITAHVTEIVPRREFATWRAARVVSDHDLNTFLIRIDPARDAADGLEPGMTVLTTSP
jgi:multidrug resistance efflux pump